MSKKEKTLKGTPVVASAYGKFVRTTARKARLVADQVRNKTVGEALEILQFLHRPSATPHVRRVILSAAKNAEAIHPEPETLTIGEIVVDGGPILKRIRPRAMGRAVRVRKRLCHIQVHLTE